MNKLDINNFNKKHDFLICIDSDGTAIDAMNAKHNLCHGPSFIEEWNLEEKKEEIQNMWNQINLYNETRGVNRFIALVDILEQLNGNEVKVSGLDVLKNWVNNTLDLSNSGLKKEIERTDEPLLKKALVWSYKINERIAKLSYQDKPPFEGIKEFLDFALGKADIAVISSSNMSAIQEEWTEHGLIQYLDVMTSQEIGTKGECLAQMLKKGYKPEQVLMIGDAYPDLDAANENKTFFYPILTNHEKHSWNELQNKYFQRLLTGNFNEVQQEVLDKFKYNFGKKGELDNASRLN
jgi:phosphoglycolate phosphatase-like HAD superfamily hydrolase